MGSSEAKGAPRVQITSDADVPISGMDDLLEPFHRACKPPSEFRVGTEAEKFGWLTDSGQALPYEGPCSIQGVLKVLADRFGWTPERERPEGDVIALRRDGASITLEPAGQLELSGAPLRTIHETRAEFEQHFAELREICSEQPIAWLSLGFHPFARQADLPHVPKLRYGIMESYLPTRGSRALDMMRRTCTVQANLDYASEADALRKLRVSLALQPVVTAMFANSPFYEGARSGRVSERADVWLHMDPDRSGLLPFAWEKDMSFRTYVEWALDVPMFLIKRKDHVTSNTEQTFREFMRDGRRGDRPVRGDWTTHLNTLFPEARLKNTLEMRGADAQPGPLLCALPALWKGLLYDETALSRAESLIGSLTPVLLESARPEIARLGLRAQLAARPLQVWASEVLEIAADGLSRLREPNMEESEAIYLTGIARLIHEGRSPADALVAKVREGADFVAQVVAAARI
jgi:glutamate--cysteine ligase